MCVCEIIHILLTSLYVFFTSYFNIFLQLSDTAFEDHEYSALYLATLYASLASDLENDYMRAKPVNSNPREDSVNKSDLIKPIFQETLNIACGYLHAAAKFNSQSGVSTVLCSRDEVMANQDEYLEILRTLVEDITRDGEPLFDVFAMHSNEAAVNKNGAAASGGIIAGSNEARSEFQRTIPAQFKEMVDARFLLYERFYLPIEALLFTMTEEHLPPAFNLRLAVNTVLELVSSRAHTCRHTARGHHYVLEHSERNHNQGIVDPILNKDVMMIMEYYSQNRLKSFYSNCFYTLSKRAAFVQKKFSKRCGCSEAAHITVTTV